MMFVMFAEIDWTKTLAAVGVLFALVCVNLGTLITNWKRFKLEQIREEDKKQIQIEQRDCLRQLEKGQNIQNGKLSAVTELNATHYAAVMEISKIRHEETLRVMQSSCKHVPTIVQQINRENP